MKIAITAGILVFLGLSQLLIARPFETEDEKEMKATQIYVLGNLYNVAVSEDFSKTQSASDSIESEWNSTDILKQVDHDSYRDEDRARAHDVTRLLIYAHGNAPNVTNSYQAVKFQSSENYGTSDYDDQNFGIKVDFVPHD